MSTTALGAAVVEWGSLVGWLVALSAAGVAWYQAHNSREAGVSGDEREARRDEMADRRDTIADRDAQIASLFAERREFLERIEKLTDRIVALEQQHEDTRTALMIHGAWDWQAIELAHRAGVTIPPPPPLMSRPPSQNN